MCPLLMGVFLVLNLKYKILFLGWVSVRILRKINTYEYIYVQTHADARRNILRTSSCAYGSLASLIFVDALAIRGEPTL